MADPTPGEICYETLVAQTRRQVQMFPWRLLDPETQTAWEAAAQAVLAWHEEQEEDP